jgi:hypothetical protein
VGSFEDLSSQLISEGLGAYLSHRICRVVVEKLRNISVCLLLAVTNTLKKLRKSIKPYVLR